jgi:LysR family transcriptional regulator, nod-box dependent transcriptional activator
MPAAKNLRQINLNSLPVLREILRHGSIAKAADKLNLTPPALSNTLRQLRGYFDDELIIRCGRDMRLTPKAQQILQPLEDALASLQTVLDKEDFDAAKSTEQFQIAMTDHSMAILAAPLTAIMSDEAPNMRARFISASSSTISDIISGKIEMIVTPRAIFNSVHSDYSLLDKIMIEPLISEPFVCMGHIDDKALSDGLSVEQYLSRPHAGFQLNADLHAGVEQSYLASMGLKQHDRILLSSYQLLPMVVATTGCLSLVPLSVAVVGARSHPIQYVTPPIKFPEFELVMLWHKRNDISASNNWLRETLQRCVAIPEADSRELPAPQLAA